MDVARLDFRTLSRIAALLMALAVLAERAGIRSLPVRWLVLSILRRVEPVAQAFVVDATQTDWPCLEDVLEVDSGPLDAAWLAWRFRLLAALLGALVRVASFLASASANIDRVPRRLAPHRLLAACGGWGPAPHDTS